MMRRSSRQSMPTSPYRSIAHHAASHGTGPSIPESVSSLLRSFSADSQPSRPIRSSPLTASTIPDMPLDLLDRIRSFPLFISAPESFVAAIGKLLKPAVHAAHDVILNEGDDARAMYWLVRGVVAVTSRDQEAVYAELTPGAFFGEIGVLMNIPRTATIVARTKCLLVVLKREDLMDLVPGYPQMEQVIRQEAQERLAILAKKRSEAMPKVSSVGTRDTGMIEKGTVVTVNTKKRKSPSPGVKAEDPASGGSVLGSGTVSVRNTLASLPLFEALPTDILHGLGLSAIPASYPPFTDIITQGMQGNEIFFIVRGEAEVIRAEEENGGGLRRVTRSSYVRPRLKAGQYFGEVASLGLSEGRTATVRSITAVECLVIGGDALEELWRKCPPEIRSSVEETARSRWRISADEGVDLNKDGDVEMTDAADEGNRTMGLDKDEPSTPTKQMLPQVTFTTPSKLNSPTNLSLNDEGTRLPSDPDPFLSVDMENLRNRRRNSLAPPTPQSDTASPTGVNGTRNHVIDGSPLKFFTSSSPPPSPPEESHVPFKRARTLPARPHPSLDEKRNTATLPDEVLVSIFKHLDLLSLLRLRIVSPHWRHLLTTSPLLCTSVDLSQINRRVTDQSITRILAPFLGERPRSIDISNCFHVTDEGFETLWRHCGRNVTTWKMRSVWDVSASQILEMCENAKGLRELDWSNCRKVGDNLLARVVGWVVPEPPPQVPSQAKGVVIVSSQQGKTRSRATSRGQCHPQQNGHAPPPMPPPGTIIGCPHLRTLNLSYCKHITDRSMAHLAAHASHRLESLTLTRCTSITDAGFQAWAPYRFTQLTHLVLADCTYLSDNSIIALVNAAKGLTHLDLSFCCALSDTATEVVALGLPMLQELRMAFCGSAVSDASLGCIALHLNELRGLSVRGCVRVTGVGVENVLEGCGRLEWLDVSQCKNLGQWVGMGGWKCWGFDDRNPSSKDENPYGKGTENMNGEKMLTLGGGGTGGRMGPGGVGYGSLAASPIGRPKTRTRASRGGGGMGTLSGMGGMAGGGPMMRPVVPPKGMERRVRKPVRFVVEKGKGLR